MEDQAKFERMLKMLFLLASGRKYSLQELSDRFWISVRTVNRYISTFRSVGLIVDCSNSFYSIRKLEKPFKELGDLLYFSEEEAYVLRKAIHAIDDTNVLKSNLIRKLYTLYDDAKLVDTVVNPDHSEIVHLLVNAIREKKQVLLRQYRSSHGNIVRDRLVEPFDFSTNFISVWAYEPEAGKCKMFKTARIDSVEVLKVDDKFNDLHKKDPEDVFRISTGHKSKIGLALSLRARNLLVEEYPLAEQFVTRVNDNLWHFHTEVCGYEGVGRFVMGLAEDVQVIDNEEFKLFLADHAKIILSKN